MQSKKMNFIKNLLYVIIGSLLLSFACAFFYLPHSIISGGISGIAIILNSLIKTNLTWLNEEFYIVILEWLFFILGFLILGKKFAFQTLCSTIVFPIGVYIFGFIYENVSVFQLEPSTINYLLSALFGGLLTGIGVGITFLGGGSTGGVDIPTLIFYKYLKIKVSISSFVIDTTVIIAGIFVIQKFDLALIGIIAAFVAAIAMDKIFLGGKATCMAYIISEKYEEINKFILNKMERGTTLLDAQGGYSGNKIKVIQVCFNIKEYSILKNAIQNIDEYAFFSVVKAHEITGEGFSNKAEFDKSLFDTMVTKDKGDNNE